MVWLTIEAARAYRKKWYYKNQERMLKYNKEWRLKNADKEKVRGLVY